MASYIAIDMKSFYASVECVSRGLDPLTANLLVADETRSDQTICLAVSPSLKAKGVPSRPRLFEAKQAIRLWEAKNRRHLNYVIAMPRMAEYERVSSRIYSVFLRYAGEEHIHVYSIDESFIYCDPYLSAYQEEAEALGIHPARLMAMTMVRAVLDVTGITATVGIGTNLYLAKVALDILAKKAPADENGFRIAELDELSYRCLLWDHTPLTDFWQVGPGKASRLMQRRLYTMGDVAVRSQTDEEWFYRTFGIDGEILIDHAWGIEPVTMKDIKSYKSEGHSLSNGQVLPRPYKYPEAQLVFKEMIESLCNDLFAKNLVTKCCTWWVSYDYKSLEACPNYDGPVSLDFYGRLHPKHSNGTVRLKTVTNNLQLITDPMVKQFDEKTDHRLLYRKLGVCACDVAEDIGMYQMNMFVDYEALERDRRLTAAMLEVRKRYGANAVFKGMDMLEGATTLERNTQIGGHKA